MALKKWNGNTVYTEDGYFPKEVMDEINKRYAEEKAKKSSSKIVIPEGVKTLDDKAFCDNQNIEYVSFPSSLTRIGNHVFSGCHNLREIHFSHLQPMNNGSWIFYDCPNLKKAFFPDWESFWNYSYDTVGPLENGTELYIGGRKASVAIITPNATNFRNLAGACGIKEKRFFTQGDLVVVGYGHIITARSLVDEVFREYPGSGTTSM